MPSLLRTRCAPNALKISSRSPNSDTKIRICGKDNYVISVYFIMKRVLEVSIAFTRRKSKITRCYTILVIIA